MEIPVAVNKDFKIEIDDGEINVTFRQATTGDDMARAALFSERKQSRRRDGEVVDIIDMDWLRLAATEVRLTLVECDITENDKKLLKPGMREEAFMAAWNKLPSRWANELHKACLQVNPDWDFTGAQSVDED